MQKKIKVHEGWKPGAVSKRLLYMLNKAKSRKSAVEEIKQTRRVKKMLEDKSTLKISKKDGQYCIELQPTSDSPVEFNHRYTPLIYKIESENIEAKIKKQARLRRRLTKAAVKEVWSNPHQRNCEMTCLKGYKEAIGIMSLDEEGNTEQEEEVDTIDSCSCEDEEVSSSCTSSDVDFEMNFTPPIMRYKAVQRDTAHLSVV